jgi:phosphoglucomutase
MMPCIKKELALTLVKDLSKLAHQEVLEKKKYASLTVIEDYINGLHTVLDMKVLREYTESCPELMETLNILKCWKFETLESDYQYIDELIIKEINRRNIPCNFSKEEEKSLSWSKRVY